jgi:lipid II:glycine glycyltransferase (peptidoglycan interpeptide bridge formation enzyme)
MSNENMKRQMEFIVEQQALFAAKMPQLEEGMRELKDLVVRFVRGTRDRFGVTDHRLKEIDERLLALIDSQIRTDENFKKTDAKLAALTDSQIRTEENLKKTDENLKKTDANLKETDEALKKLIRTVDRHISEGRNGNSRNN